MISLRETYILSIYELLAFTALTTAQEAPKTGPRDSQEGSKTAHTAPTRPQRRPRGLHNGPKRGPGGGVRTENSSFPPHDGPRTPQEAPKRAQEAPKRPPRGPRRLPEGPKEDPRGTKTDPEKLRKRPQEDPKVAQAISTSLYYDDV